VSPTRHSLCARVATLALNAAGPIRRPSPSTAERHPRPWCDRPPAAQPSSPGASGGRSGIRGYVTRLAVLLASVPGSVAGSRRPWLGAPSPSNGAVSTGRTFSHDTAIGRRFSSRRNPHPDQSASSSFDVPASFLPGTPRGRAQHRGRAQPLNAASLVRTSRIHRRPLTFGKKETFLMATVPEAEMAGPPRARHRRRGPSAARQAAQRPRASRSSVARFASSSTARCAIGRARASDPNRALVLSWPIRHRRARSAFTSFAHRPFQRRRIAGRAIAPVAQEKATGEVRSTTQAVRIRRAHLRKLSEVLDRQRALSRSIGVRGSSMLACAASNFGSTSRHRGRSGHLFRRAMT